MHDFRYIKDKLYCEGVSVEEIAETVGTPLYLYSYKTLVSHAMVFEESFNGFPHVICYAVKANSNLAILRLLFGLGWGADIVSGGELFRVLKAGCAPDRIVFSGVGKQRHEIEEAIKAGILLFNVESVAELDEIDRIARHMKRKASIGLRVNPDIDPRTHPYISTGFRKNKFGIDIKSSIDQYRYAKKLKGLNIVGISCHIGSQLTELSPFVDALHRLKQLVLRLKKEGIDIKYLDFGGGLGISYNGEIPPHPKEYANAIIEEVKGLNCRLILEPGRVIVGNAGVLVTKVIYTKHGPEKNFVIVDAGMNDLIRPSLYGAFQEIVPVCRSRSKKIVADIVGPICESADFLARERKIDEPGPGGLLAVMSAGAYGFSMSSNYNSRPRAAEVMVKGEKFYIIRKREEYRDIVRGEQIPIFLKRGTI